MRRVLQVFLGIVVVVSGIVLYNLLRGEQWAHSWLKIICAMLPEAGTIIAIAELQHSAEANDLREERNRLAKESNDLTEENRKLNAERNEHLALIAKGVVERPQTPAERNATRLRRYLGNPVDVTNHDNSRWGTPPLIAEVSDENIVAFFLPSQSGGQATAIYADCADVEITEIAQGACPLQIKVNKRYGNLVQLGSITKWEDRNSAAATPRFERGGAVVNAQYSKQGTAETRTISVFSSKDGTNSFLLEASTGEKFVGDNKAVSIRFLSAGGVPCPRIWAYRYGKRSERISSVRVLIQRRHGILGDILPVSPAEKHVAKLKSAFSFT